VSPRAGAGAGRAPPAYRKRAGSPPFGAGQRDSALTVCATSPATRTSTGLRIALGSQGLWQEVWTSSTQREGGSSFSK
jgi:hypothetical protein